MRLVCAPKPTKVSTPAVLSIFENKNRMPAASSKNEKGEIRMIRFIFAVVSFCLMIGIGEVLVKMTYRMATRAEHAFQHDQISYEQFTKAMIEAKPRIRRQNKL
jgi:hypothetical protein